MKVDLRGITKRWPGVVAADGVDLSVTSGEVHALLGENGAGKTNLMNILFGLHPPDEGEMLLDDDPFQPRSPADAIRAGIGMVNQHFMLVPVFTVAENVMLGTEPTGALGRLDRGQARQRVGELSERYRLATPTSSPPKASGSPCSTTRSTTGGLPPKPWRVADS